MAEEQQLPTRITVDIASEVEVGVFANFVSLWHDQDSFTLDFAAITRPPAELVDEDGTEYVGLKARIVARVRIPPSQIFEIMKVMEQQLSAWERENGHRVANPGESAA
ncbi:hypothetical protein JOF53_002764 [Crossiella equi]|uniref:DUF3467 domain-containing protein n=1 Tax=Crossiella equi TaxID=130796 RepID=A0ABS5AC67_9PSEU|nr:DUF3467 domain-containing protein [Crossiella equi]MBP2473892.1 hypothetical protein [Crossiella equi]